MLENLLMVAVVVVGLQSVVIAMLVKLVNRARTERDVQKKEAKQVIQGLVRVMSNKEKELKDYKDAYNACYAEYKSVFASRKEINKRLDYVEGLHSHMVNNMHLLLKQGRVIKSKYMDQTVVYADFSNLKDDDRKELFGA